MGRIFYCVCWSLFLMIMTLPRYLEAQTQMTLSLQECILLTLKSNLSVQVQSMGPKIQGSAVIAARGSLEPYITIGPMISHSDEPSFVQSPNIMDSRSGDTRSIVVGITDPTSIGMRYGLYLNANQLESSSQSRSNNPVYRSGLTFSITQPLLKGFGPTVNRYPITLAENNRDISLLGFKSQLIRTIYEAQNVYWELVYAYENLNVQRLALKQAQELLNINQKRREIGKASLSDVLQAQAAVASREADIISAEAYIKTVEDRLRRVTNIVKDESSWEVTILPEDVPSYEEIKVDLQESIKTALEKRPDYMQAKIDIKNSDIQIKVASNQRLPQLDLEGSLALNGLGSNIGEPFSQIRGGDYNSWSASVSLRLPIGGKTGNGALKKSLLEKEQKLLALKDLEQRIVAEVRDAVRKVETDKKRIDAAIKAEEFARQVLETERRKYELGTSTSYDILQFQANLATASKNRLRAVIDYRQSVANLYQVMGVTLEKLGIEVKVD